MRGTKTQDVETSANLADAIGYARSEFRDGRSEREVYELLLRSGQPTTIRGMIHELYLESLGVHTRDQVEKSMALTIGVLLIVTAGLLITREWWIALVLAASIGLYTLAVDRAFNRHWHHRAHRKN